LLATVNTSHTYYYYYYYYYYYWHHNHIFKKNVLITDSDYVKFVKRKLKV